MASLIRTIEIFHHVISTDMYGLFKSIRKYTENIGVQANRQLYSEIGYTCSRSYDSLKIYPWYKKLLLA